MVRPSILVFFALISSPFLVAQKCDCLSNFQWVKKTFEENDAGYKYALELKGIPAYEVHNANYLKKITKANTSEECTKLLYEWLTFFRKGHIGIIRNQAPEPVTTKDETHIHKNWETIAVQESEFYKYLDQKSEPGFEGVWKSDPYIIGIKKFGKTYKGFILETTVETWKKGEVKVNFDNYKGDFYLRNKTTEVFEKPKMVGINHLQLGRFFLTRVYPKYETENAIAAYLKSTNATSAYFDTINENTVLLRIPSFDGSQKKSIDSVVLANRSRILETENLIIDIRNNGGGSDWSYREIIPILYTNPIRIVGAEFLSTKLNNQRMLDLANNPDFGLDEQSKKWAKDAYDTLEKHLGEFVNLDSSKVVLQKFDTVHPYPKNIAILINQGNASTSEQFLLAARQSKKVKLFGTTTMGVLDISNMLFVKSPCKEFELGYCLTKSFRIPHLTIDNKGIQPDFYLDDNIEDHQWLDFVVGILAVKGK